jgi:hypothetical protein
MVPRDLFDKPYHERQLIAFIPDAVYNESQNARPPEKLDANSALGAALIGLLGRRMLTRFVFLPGGWFAVELPLAIFQLWQQWRDKQRRKHVLLVPQSLSRHLSLPVGHPSRRNQVYAGHPADPKTYFPLAEFHRFMFEHKYAELLRLLSSLGAKKIKGKYIRGWKRDLITDTSLEAAQVKGSGHFSRNTADNSSIVCDIELNNDRKPKLPDSLVWYPFENIWQELARERLNHGLTKITVNLEYVDDFGISAKLKTQIQAAKFELGGRFKDHSQTIWEFAVDFTSPSTSKPES